jgi:flagellum-specific ATP synthase
MGRKSLGHSGQFQFLEHRGFSLDLLHQGLRVIPLETVIRDQKETDLPGIFDPLRAEIASIEPYRVIGRVSEIGRGTFLVTGLAAAALGDRVLAETGAGGLGGEIVRLSSAGATILPEDDPEGLMIGARVELVGPATLAPGSDWLGRIVDPLGRPLDGRPLLRGLQARPMTGAPPAAAQRRGLGERLSTGVAVFDTLLPLVRGQRIGLFAGSGVGKSSLLARFARGVAADVVVIALVGERGRELRDFTERVLGSEGMARSVVVTATSDQSALQRRRCALSALTVAEHFRDQGLHVLLLVDSVTRFAEAHREVALASGEAASLRGYPPSTAHAIMSLAERAGPGGGEAGDITAVLSVLVAGSDMEEPVADIIRGTLDGHVVLDRKIAERGRYPAIDLLRSVSRSLPEAASSAENALISDARRTLGAYDRAEMMVHAGLYVQGTDPVVDRAIRLWPQLDGFLAEDAPAGGPDASFARLRACLQV